MSSADKPADDEVCASCGIKGGNNIKLKTCDGCKLVKYCSVECQRKHRSRHKRACKKRAAELREELLFQQPECTHLGECPICFVPIPFETDEQTGGERSGALLFCCSKYICIGCIYECKMQGLEEKCPFCRTPYPLNDAAKAQKMINKQYERGNPDAIRYRADKCMVEGNYNDGFKYYVQAAKGGDIEAHLQLGRFFLGGEGEDQKKATFHYEEAAIGGHPVARDILGVLESTLGNNQKAVKHWIIGAKLGSKDVLEQLKKGYKYGIVSKEAFQEGLRGCQEAVNAMKTPQREAAKQNFHLLGIVCDNEAQK